VLRSTFQPIGFIIKKSMQGINGSGDQQAKGRKEGKINARGIVGRHAATFCSILNAYLTMVHRAIICLIHRQLIIAYQF
jgi:hypothetical protein